MSLSFLPSLKASGSSTPCHVAHGTCTGEEVPSSKTYLVPHVMTT
nr:MAG TPA: hypothetical protein [Caudoviricetes sp.]